MNPARFDRSPCHCVAALAAMGVDCRRRFRSADGDRLDRPVQTAIIEPVDVFAGGGLDDVEASPRTEMSDQLGVVAEPLKDSAGALSSPRDSAEVTAPA